MAVDRSAYWVDTKDNLHVPVDIAYRATIVEAPYGARVDEWVGTAAEVKLWAEDRRKRLGNGFARKKNRYTMSFARIPVVTWVPASEEEL